MNATLIEKTFIIHALYTCKICDNSLHANTNNLIYNIIESDKIEYSKELEKLFKVSYNGKLAEHGLLQHFAKVSSAEMPP